MYLESELKKYSDKKIKLFVDMDGVIAHYEVGKASEFDKKRPLTTSILKLEKISKYENIELYILSVTRKNEGIEEKNYWLDKYAPFFKPENRNIISKEMNKGTLTSDLKANFFKNIIRDNSILIYIDDDPQVIKRISATNEDIVLYKDTVLVD